MNKIRAILHVIWLILVPFLIANGILYLIGSFVAFDGNPLNWWLFTSTWGRLIFIFIEISILSQTPNFWED